MRNRLSITISLLVCLAVGIVGLMPLSVAAETPTNADYAAGEVLVKLRPGFALSDQMNVQSSISGSTALTAQAHAQSLAVLLAEMQAFRAEAIRPQNNTYRVEFTTSTDAAGLAGQLASHPAVVFAEPNYIRHIMRTPNDPLVVEQWALTNIQAFEAWDVTTGGSVPIAVLDTGVLSSHPDLDGKVLPGYNAVTESDRSEDDNGHGTAVSGLIAARTDNDTGIAGMCWDCPILPVKVLTSRGSGRDDVVARGIYWATDSGARVINLSLGGSGESQVLREAVQYANGRGVLVISSTGNERQSGNAINYPAAYPEVLAVGGTGNTDTITGFSNTGDHVDLAAPSVGLWTTIPGEREYGPPNGTSFSTPYVSGVAGLVWTLRPDLSNTDVKCILEASADDKGEPGKDPEYGWGRLNALRAVQLAQSYDGCPLSQPAPPAEPGPPSPTGTPPAFAPVAPGAVPTDRLYFAETQHTLGGAFRVYWEAHGGLPIFGYPISEEFVELNENGEAYTVQYFQRHRFEYHPGQAPPYDVQLSRLGDLVLQAQGRSWFTFPKGSETPGCLFFEATGHTLCEPFLSYWRSNGLEFDGQPGKSFEESLALFGQPLSEPQVEEVSPGVFLTVQWFERARFEDHGANGGVLLGLLSSELVRARGWTQ